MLFDVQDGWKVETRVRLSGKQQGSQYKCFKSPTGAQYWSIRQAMEHGFTGLESGEPLDGRRKRMAAGAKKPGSKLSPKSGSKSKPGKKAGCKSKIKKGTGEARKPGNKTRSPGNQ